MASQDKIAVEILESIKETPYACSSLDRLSGGSANFTYRGTLLSALPSGEPTVVIKHTEPYVATMPSFALDAVRSRYESAALTAMHTFTLVSESGITVKTPYMYLFNESTHNQIIQDFPNSVELKRYMQAHTLSESESRRLGVALGSWTKRFHGWGDKSEQEHLKRDIEQSKMSSELKFFVNYGRLEETVDLFPDVLGRCRDMFKELADCMNKELKDTDNPDLKLIHGDFWTGNILLADKPLASLSHNLDLFVVDWELTQVAHPACDLGQMFAELFLLKHFRNIDAALYFLSSFMRGYGSIDDEFAYRVAIQFGVHLIVWPCRVTGWGEKEEIQKVVEIGRDFIEHAWRKNKAWFKGGVLHDVFYTDKP
ncbi:hypothetical protein V490_05338 [Pseudogymnoascus sp. VKM F-3557]|nr:hypothetical protein V490_05338 [Pseudogymnoascus sp. VKM F-3557]